MSDEIVGEPESQFSKYNAGVAIQIRLDGLWKDVNNHSRLGQFAKWNSDLDRVWSELARDLKEKDYDDIIKDGKVISKGKKSLIIEFDNELANLGGFEDNANESFQTLTKEQITKRDNQYKKLMEKELFLKRLENFLGKGTAWDDKDEDDF